MSIQPSFRPIQPPADFGLAVLPPVAIRLPNACLVAGDLQLLAKFKRTVIMVAVNWAIETTGLTRQFGKVCAVDGIDLRVERGTFYGFLGPNGAGKSTTIKMLTGLLAPTSGAMRILGADVADQESGREVKRRLGVVPENLGLFENLTAREYLVFIGRMYLLPRETIRARADELLVMMGLENEEKKLTLEYSHGMRKKLALAAALLPNPELLFLDEPFEGVDAVASRVLRDTLKRCVERGATVFLTSHVLEIVEKLCTHVGVIAKGKLVHQEPMVELRAKGSLEERFLEAVGAGQFEPQKLSWLESER
jgi:ABC-2 type transport system ATP-binding protein